jgi:hypothetical protein
LEVSLQLHYNMVANAWNAIADFLEQLPSRVESFFRDFPANLANFFQQAAWAAIEAIKGIPAAIASIPDQIVSLFEMIPRAISQILKNITVPQLHFVGDFNLDPKHLKLPRLEVYGSGGIVTKPTNALLGEAGYPEAVLPLTSRYLTPLLAAADVHSGGGDTYNVINGLEVAPDDYIQEVMVEFFNYLQRKAAMQRG